jgi:tripartite ATP-independent transporter DctM subunit
MSIEVITLLAFSLLIIGIFASIPIAFALGGIGIGFIFFMWGPSALAMLSNVAYGWMKNYYLQCAPMFIFMALALEQSGIIQDLYKMMRYWSGELKGGLAIGTVIACTLFAAMVGLGGVGVITLGVVALPEMRKHGYNMHLSMGAIMAGSALGSLIPPSLTMILFGIISQVSIGKLFLGGVIPGIMSCGIFIIYIAIRCKIQPRLGPSLSERIPWSARIESLKSLIAPIVLILMVLGAIFGGVCTAVEAASFGAVGSVVYLIISRKFSWQSLQEICLKTLGLTCVIGWLIIGASLFTSVYTGLGAKDMIQTAVLNMPLGGHWGILIMMQIILIALGCFLDPSAILMITVPVFLPIIKTLGFDPLWFGILFVMNMEIGYLTPPFGLNLFLMRVVSKEVGGLGMNDIYLASVPFLLLQVTSLALIMIFPGIALWLPNLLLS